MCVLVSGLYSVPYYEVARIFHPGFQPQVVATPVLDSGFPRALFEHDNEVFVLMKRCDIIHIIIYNRYEYNRQRDNNIQEYN